MELKIIFERSRRWEGRKPRVEGREWRAAGLCRLTILTALMVLTAEAASEAPGFEGRIEATLTQGGETRNFLYTVSTNYVRIERVETNWPHARNIVNRQSGEVTLLFPHNRSFVRLKRVSESAGPQISGIPGGPPTALPPVQPGPPGGLPPGTRPVGAGPEIPPVPLLPGGLPPGIGPQGRPTPGAPPMTAVSGFPIMPMPPREKAELKATGERTNILGFACTRYELKERGETMEIWATERLPAFERWLQDQPPRFGPRMIEEQWPEVLQGRKLFPLLASLRYENGAERLRFEVKSITPEKIGDPDGKLFQPPRDYHEIEALPW